MICENGFFFDVHTFIYGNEIEDYEVQLLKEVYGIEGVDFEIVGKLKKNEFKSLLDCLNNSSSIKRRIKRILLS